MVASARKRGEMKTSWLERFVQGDEKSSGDGGWQWSHDMDALNTAGLVT